MTPHWGANTLHGQAANRTLMMRNAFMCMEKDPRKENGMTIHAVWLQKMQTLILPQLFFAKKQSVEAIEECHADYCAWSTSSRPLTTVAIHGFRLDSIMSLSRYISYVAASLSCYCSILFDDQSFFM